MPKWRSWCKQRWLPWRRLDPLWRLLEPRWAKGLQPVRATTTGSSGRCGRRQLWLVWVVKRKSSWVTPNRFPSLYSCCQGEWFSSFPCFAFLNWHPSKERFAHCVMWFLVIYWCGMVWHSWYKLGLYASKSWAGLGQATLEAPLTTTHMVLWVARAPEAVKQSALGKLWLMQWIMDFFLHLACSCRWLAVKDFFFQISCNILTLCFFCWMLKGFFLCLQVAWWNARWLLDKCSYDPHICWLTSCHFYVLINGSFVLIVSR
jgi:hypothetical protein